MNRLICHFYPGLGVDPKRIPLAKGFQTSFFRGCVCFFGGIPHEPNEFEKKNTSFAGWKHGS